MLHFDKVSLRRGPQLLFSDASFQIHPGQKVGVTGANGCGKSSLFSMVLGELGADDGEVSHPSDWAIAHLAQETPETQRPAIEYVLDGDRGLRDLQARLARAEAEDRGDRIAQLHAELDHIGGYRANSRAAQLMAGLGFRSGDERRPVAEFSGGWRMRLNLAQTLMCRAELLLLDEPTNHLDLDAVIWLEGWLRQYPGTLLLISHDRDFLDSVCNQVLHIEQRRATLYTGNYTAFERIRAEQLANQQAAYEKQQREIAHMQRFVERFRAKATKARQAQSRIKALERMQQIAPAHVDSPFHFGFRAPEKLPHPLLKIEDAGVGYAGTPVLRDIHLVLGPGDRLGLLGPNGAGKSTLVRLLAGELAPIGGARTGAQDLKVGYFAQHQLEQLHPDHTPVEHLQQLDPQLGEQAARDFLGGFGFGGDKALEEVAPFSGGEKSRLVLALLVYQRPNLLLLDEPTNHLDLEMRQALATALQDFEGATVIVSHDRHLLRLGCDRLLLVANAGIEDFADDLDAYPAWLTAHHRAAEPRREPDTRPGSAEDRRERKRIEAERRKALQPLRRAVERCEAEVDRLHARQGELESRLADETLYQTGRKGELQQLMRDKAEVDRRLAEAEEAWMQATEELERAS